MPRPQTAENPQTLAISAEEEKLRRRERSRKLARFVAAIDKIEAAAAKGRGRKYQLDLVREVATAIWNSHQLYWNLLRTADHDASELEVVARHQSEQWRDLQLERLFPDVAEREDRLSRASTMLLGFLESRAKTAHTLAAKDSGGKLPFAGIADIYDAVRNGQWSVLGRRWALDRSIRLGVKRPATRSIRQLESGGLLDTVFRLMLRASETKKP